VLVFINSRQNKFWPKVVMTLSSTDKKRDETKINTSIPTKPSQLADHVKASGTNVWIRTNISYIGWGLDLERKQSESTHYSTGFLSACHLECVA